MATERESVELIGDGLVGNIARVAPFATLMDASGCVSFLNPTSSILVTIQVLVVFPVGIFLGLIWGGDSITFHLAAGGLDAPMFAGGSAELASLVGPTAGYLWLYPIAAVVVGLVVHGGISADDYHVSTPRSADTMVVETVVAYAFGMLDFAYVNCVGLEPAFWAASTVFIPVEAFEITAAVGVVCPDAIAAQQTIRVEGFVCWHGDAVTVNGVDLAVDDGERVVVVGTNGSDKTALVHHFNGLFDPDEGVMSINGRTVSGHLVAARIAVAMVFQHPEDRLVTAIVGTDVAFSPENLDLDRDDIGHRARESPVAVNLDGREDECVDSLSSDEVERPAIADALTMRPDHFVLDEPFTGLDEPARRSVLARLRNLHAERISLVVVTHDLHDVAELADRMVVLVDGNVALDAAPDEVADRLPDPDACPLC